MYCKPEHVLLIPDGNRRYAKKFNLDLNDAYVCGASKITDTISWILDIGDSKQLTVYGLAYENIAHRNSEELDPIVDAWSNEFIRWSRLPLVHDLKINITIRGECDTLSTKFQRAKNMVESATCGYNNKNLVILIGYSGRREILSLFSKSFDGFVDEKAILRNMTVNNPIDLVIRTSNTLRLSDCPLFQISYAEFIFIEKYFPELNRDDILSIYDRFNTIERNFGS